MELIQVEAENTAPPVGPSGVTGKDTVTIHKSNLQLGDWSATQAISGQRESCLPFNLWGTFILFYWAARTPATRLHRRHRNVYQSKIQSSCPQHVSAHPATKLCLWSPGGTRGSRSPVLLWGQSFSKTKWKHENTWSKTRRKNKTGGKLNTGNWSKLQSWEMWIQNMEQF